MRMKHIFPTEKAFLCAVTLLSALCGRALSQGAALSQDHDSGKGRASSRGTIEIVSGHEGLDSNRYLGEIFQRLNAQQAFQAKNVPVSKPGKLVVEFVILRDGSVDSIKVVNSTVDQAVSQAQMDAIRSAAPFPALPEEFKGKSLKLRLHSEFTEKRSSSSH
jgi:TonB family protein